MKLNKHNDAPPEEKTALSTVFRLAHGPSLLLILIPTDFGKYPFSAAQKAEEPASPHEIQTALEDAGDADIAS